MNSSKSILRELKALAKEPMEEIHVLPQTGDINSIDAVIMGAGICTVTCDAWFAWVLGSRKVDKQPKSQMPQKSFFSLFCTASHFTTASYARFVWMASCV
jgi:LPXTG-motif cell wall-anchored protein